MEMLATLAITGILAAIAAPSFLSEKKDLREAVIPIETLIKTVNLSAKANSGNPYRITLVNSSNGRQYIRAATFQNGSCNPATTNQLWRNDPKLEFLVPADIQISNFPSTTTNGICFNGRGEVNGGQQTFDIIDPQERRTKIRANITVSVVGDIKRTTYNKSGTSDASGKLD